MRRSPEKRRLTSEPTLGCVLMYENKKRILLFFFIVSAIVIMADQITKFLVIEFIPLNTSETVLPGFLNLVHVRNSGAAFGVFADRGNLTSRAILSAISFLALLAILWIVISQPLERYALIGFALFFWGCCGEFSGQSYLWRSDGFYRHTISRTTLACL